MANPITVGFSPLTNTIFAGRSKPMLKGSADTRIFVGEKFDVTQQALAIVAQLMVKRDDILIIPIADGRIIHLRADVKEANNGPNKQTLKSADAAVLADQAKFGKLYADNNALTEQVRALASENATLRNLQPTELMVSSAHAEAEQYNNLNLDDDLIVFMWQAMHSVIKTPATDECLREIRAQSVEGFIAFNVQLAQDYPTAMVAKSLEVTELNGEHYAARIRSGEV